MSLEFQLLLFKKYIKLRYATKSKPCGMPNSCTYSSFLQKYFIGTATKISSRYDTPSKNATALNSKFTLFKGAFPSYIKTSNKQVDVMSSFIGNYRL